MVPRLCGQEWRHSLASNTLRAFPAVPRQLQPLLSSQFSHPSMALLLRFPSHNTSLSFFLCPPGPTHKPPLFPLSQPLLGRRKGNAAKNKCGAVSDIKAAPPPVLDDESDDHKVLLGPSSEEESRGERVVAEYDWTQEWYPLYLTQDLPDDAPLGLTVFDKHIVLYRDGNGHLRCYEDRCPHR
jgi:hypothetical protein